MEFVKLAYGVKIEFIPYAGSAPTITSLLGGHVDLGSANVSVSLSHIKAGKLKALAIASPRRVAALPDVPTVGESGKGDPPNFWLGAFAPAKTPAPIVDKLARTIEQILKDPAMTSALDNAGLIADYRNPAETRQFIDEEIRTIRNIAKSVNLK
jgi:tripartite-type tricarboxylate transporter receptor subunit TctC